MEPLILQIRQREIDLGQRTLIMGALNVTPDSFSDGGRYLERDRAVEQGVRLAREGADILDIGGESTRPGAAPVDEVEECQRIIPVLRDLRPKIDIPISIDTRKAGVAQKALQAGADMINDVSALRFDPQMAEVIAAWKVPVVLMHMQGQPQNMQADPRYDDLLGEVTAFFRERIAFAESWGIAFNQIILDPGIGFGKSLAKQHNLILLKYLGRFRALGRPLLVGTSRKTFIGEILELPPEEREEGTMATVVWAIFSGANIVRVHEVQRIKRAVKVADAILRSTPEKPESGGWFEKGDNRG